MRQESEARISHPASCDLENRLGQILEQCACCVQAIRSAWARVQAPEELLREETRAQVLGSRKGPRQDQIQAVVPDLAQVRDQGSESAAGMALKGAHETAWLSDAVPEETDAAGYRMACKHLDIRTLVLLRLHEEETGTSLNSKFLIAWG